MSDKAPIRIGLIGAGMVSTHHLQAWCRIDEGEVVAIADPLFERAREQSARFGIDQAFGDARSMLAASRLDAVDIAAPVGRHGELCRLAADCGVHVLCQKPLAETMEAAIAIVRDVGTRVRFMVHENWRFRAHYRLVKSWLDRGRIGAIESVRMRVGSRGLLDPGDGRLPALARQPFLATLPRLLVFEVLIHHLDVVRWLFGDLTVVEANLWRICQQVVGEDNARIRLRSAAGLEIALDASFTDPAAPDHVADRLEVIGTRGSIELCDTALTLRGHDQPAGPVSPGAREAGSGGPNPDHAPGGPENHRWSFEELYSGSYEGALREFATALRTGRPFESDAQDNLRTLQMVEDVYAAAAAFRPR